MPDGPAQVEIPKRALFKAARCATSRRCSRTCCARGRRNFRTGRGEHAGAPRVYRRATSQQVLRIKHLLLVEG
jgi:hypothetical protein